MAHPTNAGAVRLRAGASLAAAALHPTHTTKMIGVQFIVSHEEFEFDLFKSALETFDIETYRITTDLENDLVTIDVRLSDESAQRFATELRWRFDLLSFSTATGGLTTTPDTAGTDRVTIDLATLTDRQKMTVDTVVECGFFKWPREHTGVEVAEKMGISQPTFNKHLRATERKILRQVADTTPPPGPDVRTY